jgi:hypothetical protein
VANKAFQAYRIIIPEIISKEKAIIPKIFAIDTPRALPYNTRLTVKAA